LEQKKMMETQGGFWNPFFRDSKLFIVFRCRLRDLEPHRETMMRGRLKKGGILEGVSEGVRSQEGFEFAAFSCSIFT
jgi:hypothetical protein